MVSMKNLKKNANFFELRKQQQQQQKTNSPGEKKHLIENYGIHSNSTMENLLVVFKQYMQNHIAEHGLDFEQI
jgi:hypothetical protein